MALTVLKTILFSLRAHGHVRRFLTCSVAVLAVLLATFSSVGIAWYREFRQLSVPAAGAVQDGTIEPRGVPDSPVGLRCRQLRTAMGTRLNTGISSVRWHYVVDPRIGSAWQVVANGTEYLWIDVNWSAQQNRAMAFPAGTVPTPEATTGSVVQPPRARGAQLPTVSPATAMAALAASPMFKGCDAGRLQELVADGTGFGQFPSRPPDLPLRVPVPVSPESRQPLDPSLGLLQPRTGRVLAQANLRAGPHLNFAVRDVVEAGTEIVVVGRSIDEQWLQTESGSWIHHSLVALDAETGADR